MFSILRSAVFADQIDFRTLRSPDFLRIFLGEIHGWATWRLDMGHEWIGDMPENV